MQIHTSIRLVNGSYHSEIGLANYPGNEALTPVEAQALERFGEVVVECGGEFLGEGDNALEFELPGNARYFPSQFPVKAIFSTQDYPDGEAGERAILFRDTIKTRIEAARNYLLSLDAGFTGTDIETV